MVIFFFFNDTATTEIYTLSLHDALPIFVVEPLDGHSVPEVDEALRSRAPRHTVEAPRVDDETGSQVRPPARVGGRRRSEEHTSELQSRQYLVCRLLLEKKNNILTTLSYL